MTKSRKKKQTQADLIKWNFINSLLAGVLVFFGALSDGSLTEGELITSFAAAIIVAITKFREFWGTQEKNYHSVFNFLPL